MLASKIEQKSMLSSRGDFLKKPCFSLGKTMILKDPGVEVGSKNRSKIYQKRRSTWEGILTSIFHRFWWILGAKLEPSWHQKPTKNGCEKTSKNEAPKQTSWRPQSRFLEGGFSSAPVHCLRRGEGRVGCTKPTYPQETDPLQQNYLSDRNLLRKSVKCDK